MKPIIQTKRVYEPRDARDGFRVLVDRVWPRGLTKEQVAADLWLKQAAPSTALRQWFQHDPTKWPEFKRRYFAELGDQPQAIEQLRNAAQQGPLTLLFSARDEAHNQAVALKDYLQGKLH